jgi:hypothetical protein
VSNRKDELGRSRDASERPADQQLERDDRQEKPDDPGAYLGSRPELAADSIVDGPQRDDERVAGEATQSTGPAGRAANPDEGWRDSPAGHREGRAADDDMVKRKG